MSWDGVGGFLQDNPLWRDSPPTLYLPRIAYACALSHPMRSLTQSAQVELRTTRNQLGEELVLHSAAEKRLKADLEAALDTERDGFMSK